MVLPGFTPALFLLAPSLGGGGGDLGGQRGCPGLRSRHGCWRDGAIPTFSPLAPPGEPELTACAELGALKGVLQQVEGQKVIYFIMIFFFFKFLVGSGNPSKPIPCFASQSVGMELLAPGGSSWGLRERLCEYSNMLTARLCNSDVFGILSRNGRCYLGSKFSRELVDSVLILKPAGVLSGFSGNPSAAGATTAWGGGSAMPPASAVPPR